MDLRQGRILRALCGMEDPGRGLWKEGEAGSGTIHEALAGAFEVPVAELEGIDVLFAAYEYADYSGSALVVFLKDGKLYSIHGGHCSCNGLEGQWEPEETTSQFLKQFDGEVVSGAADKEHLLMVAEYCEALGL